MKCKVCGKECKGKECIDCYRIRSVPKRKQIVKQRQEAEIQQTIHIFDMHNVDEKQRNVLIDEILQYERKD